MWITPVGTKLSVVGVGMSQYLGPWAFLARLNGPTGLAVSVGAVGSFEATELALGRIAFSQQRSVSASNGEVRAFDFPEFTVFLWKGERYEFSGMFAGATVPFEPFVNLIQQFSILEEPEGLVLKPVLRRMSSVTFTMAMNTFVSVGPILVEPSGSPVSKAPKHAGRRVRGGSLWHESLLVQGIDVRRAVIANSTAVTTLETDSPNSDEFAALARNLRVEIAG